jgi:hypothetical protein
MEKQRGTRDVRSEFSNDFDDGSSSSSSSCCCSSSSCSCSSSIFVRSLCPRNRTHLFSPKRTVSRVHDDAFLSVFLSFYKQRVFVRREVRVFARAGRGRRKERGTGAASGTRGDDKILDVYYYKWYQQTKRKPKAAAAAATTTTTTTTESRRSARENDKQSRPTSV